jgi:hypothetical protein
MACAVMTISVTAAGASARKLVETQAGCSGQHRERARRRHT